MDVNGSSVVVAAAHFVSIGRVFVHSLLPTELVAVVVKAPIVALLIHQVEDSLVNPSAQKKLGRLFYIQLHDARD